MSNIGKASDLLAAFSGQRNTITIPRTFIDFMGSIEGGLFLNQLIFWSDKGGSKDGWFYKSYEDWQEECCLSTYKVKKYADQCKDAGFLKTKRKKVGTAPTLHYRFDFEIFTNRICEFLQIDFEKFENPMDFQNFTNLYTDNNHINTPIDSGTNGSGKNKLEQNGPEQQNEEPLSIRESIEYVTLQAAVIGACKKLDPSALKDQDREAIDILFELGVDPSEVSQHYGDRQKGWWWRHFWKGKRHQFPTAVDIVDTLGQAREFQEMDVQDERDPVALRAWHTIERAVEEGDANLIQDSQTLEAAREIWPQLKTMNDYNKNKLKADFMKRYHAAQEPNPG